MDLLDKIFFSSMFGTYIAMGIYSVMMIGNCNYHAIAVFLLK